MKVIEGGKKGKGQRSKGTKKERAEQKKLKYQAEFLKNIDELISLNEVLDKKKYDFTMTKTTEGELTIVILKFKKKKPEGRR